jgi:hypothetical protein
MQIPGTFYSRSENAHKTCDDMNLAATSNCHIHVYKNLEIEKVYIKTEEHCNG